MSGSTRYPLPTNSTPKQDRPSLHDFAFPELVDVLAKLEVSRFYAAKVWRCLYRELTTDLTDCTDIRSQIREQLDQHFGLTSLKLLKKQVSADGSTRKYLLQLHDGHAIETVIMAYSGRKDRPAETGRFTACISSQVGCAMGCVFCATGQMGFGRHLTPGEIVAQLLFCQRELAPEGQRLRNVVLMGMGEPLHNYDNVMTAIDIMTDDRGLALGGRHVTLSTVGLPDRIRQLADDERPINLAVSLHGATDETRQALVPPAKKWPLSDLLDACRTYIARRQRRIFFEWALIEGENDSPAHAHELGRLLAGMDAHVNVIPLNPTAGYNGRPSDPTRVKNFQAILRDYGLPSTVRQRRGIDIAAGCGQLASENNPLPIKR